MGEGSTGAVGGAAVGLATAPPSVSHVIQSSNCEMLECLQRYQTVGSHPAADESVQPEAVHCI